MNQALKMFEDFEKSYPRSEPGGLLPAGIFQLQAGKMRKSQLSILKRSLTFKTNFHKSPISILVTVS